jgi:Protein of unknown function (DUF3465)
MKKFLLLAAALFAGYTIFSGRPGPVPDKAASPIAQEERNADATVAEAFARHKSKVQVSGEGKVIKLLADDDSGSRHQKFIISLSSGHTLLVAHNIDLAPRVSSLRVGDSIAFYGEYEWSDKGGVLHWTHRDPRGAHVAGWLKHNGQTYQ